MHSAWLCKFCHSATEKFLKETWKPLGLWKGGLLVFSPQIIICEHVLLDFIFAPIHYENYVYQSAKLDHQELFRWKYTSLNCHEYRSGINLPISTLMVIVIAGLFSVPTLFFSYSLIVLPFPYWLILPFLPHFHSLSFSIYAYIAWCMQSLYFNNGKNPLWYCRSILSPLSLALQPEGQKAEREGYRIITWIISIHTYSYAYTYVDWWEEVCTWVNLVSI